MFILYAIKSQTTGMMYIGLTENFDSRMYSHKKQLIRKNHSNKFLQQDFNSGHTFDYIKLAEIENEREAKETERGTIHKTMCELDGEINKLSGKVRQSFHRASYSHQKEERFLIT